jgi:hypothetical protein
VPEKKGKKRGLTSSRRVGTNLYPRVMIQKSVSKSSEKLIPKSKAKAVLMSEEGAVSQNGTSALE